MEPQPVVQKPAPRIPLAKPFWTYALMGLTSLVFLLQLGLGDLFTYSYGVKINAFIRLGEYWRLITPVFFHGGMLHLFVNMYSLYNVGVEVERTFGAPRFLLVYLLTGFTGVLTSFAFSPVDSLGASGAIFGLVGAFAVLLYRNRNLLGRVGRNVFTNVIFIIFLNGVLSFSDGIDMWGHFGGLAGGIILGWLICPVWEATVDAFGRPVAIQDRQPLSRQWPLLAAFMAGLVVLTIWLVSRPVVV